MLPSLASCLSVGPWLTPARGLCLELEPSLAARHLLPGAWKGRWPPARRCTHIKQPLCSSGLCAAQGEGECAPPSPLSRFGLSLRACFGRVCNFLSLWHLATTAHRTHLLPGGEGLCAIFLYLTRNNAFPAQGFVSLAQPA